MEDIQQKIIRAREVHLRIELDPEVKKASLELLEAAQRCKEIARNMGMLKICQRCDTQEGGSCCGRGIENYYDEPLLLLNCILGVNLHTKRIDKDSCLFLGENGCVLIARHTLCVNYLCERLLNTYRTEELKKLKEAEGIELELTFRLCERLRHYFR